MWPSDRSKVTGDDGVNSNVLDLTDCRVERRRIITAAPKQMKLIYKNRQVKKAAAGFELLGGAAVYRCNSVLS